jgi:hypothetical protein
MSSRSAAGMSGNMATSGKGASGPGAMSGPRGQSRLFSKPEQRGTGGMQGKQ